MTADADEDAVNDDIQSTEEESMNADDDFEQPVGLHGTRGAIGPAAEDAISRADPPMKTAMTTVCA